MQAQHVFFFFFFEPDPQRTIFQRNRTRRSVKWTALWLFVCVVLYFYKLGLKVHPKEFSFSLIENRYQKKYPRHNHYPPISITLVITVHMNYLAGTATAISYTRYTWWQINSVLSFPRVWCRLPEPSEACQVHYGYWWVPDKIQGNESRRDEGGNISAWHTAWVYGAWLTCQSWLVVHTVVSSQQPKQGK